MGACFETPKICAFHFTNAGVPLSEFVFDSRISYNRVQAFRIFECACAGLNYLHMKKISYGNLSLDSIIVLNDFSVKFRNYGLSTFSNNERSDQKVHSHVCVRYLSPEKLIDHTCKRHEESDVYAIGLICFEIFSRKLCFENENQMALGLQVIFC